MAGTSGEPPHGALARLGLIGETELAHALAGCLNLPLIRARSCPTPPVEGLASPDRLLAEHRVLPLAWEGMRPRGPRGAVPAEPAAALMEL